MSQSIYTELKEHLFDPKSLQHIIIPRLDKSSIVKLYGFWDASERI